MLHASFSTFYQLLKDGIQLLNMQYYGMPLSMGHCMLCGVVGTTEWQGTLTYYQCE